MTIDSTDMWFLQTMYYTCLMLIMLNFDDTWIQNQDNDMHYGINKNIVSNIINTKLYFATKYLYMCNLYLFTKKLIN